MWVPYNLEPQFDGFKAPDFVLEKRFSISDFSFDSQGWNSSILFSLFIEGIKSVIIEYNAISRSVLFVGFVSLQRLYVKWPSI